MKLTSIMRKSLILPDIESLDKAGALQEMAQAIAKEFSPVSEEDLISVIMERERLSSTGIGSGIAIPHAKLASIKEHIAVFGRSRVGIPFDAIDQKPVHLIFMILGPLGANEAHLKALARISKFLHDTSFREKLFTAEDAIRVYATIEEKDQQY